MFRKVQIHIEGSVQWAVLRDHETGRYLGVCNELNLNAVGDTWGEFLACAEEAMELLLTELLKAGELESYLQRRGFRAVPLAGRMPGPHARVRWDIPFEITRRTRVEELVPA